MQWVLDARKFFTDKSVNKNTLQRFREDQTSTASCLEFVKDEEMENISYLVIGKRRDVIYVIVIKFVVGKHSHHSDPSFMKVSQAPTVTERVKGDGNFFFFFFPVNCPGCNHCRIPTGPPRFPPPYYILHDT